jgi:general secretion pathway protein L
VDLPLAALENLREVLSFEMDRHTPFKAEEVAFDYRIIGSDAVAKRIAVTIAVVPRRVVERAYGLAESFGVKPRRIGIGDDDTDARRPMDLLPPAENSEHGTLSRRLSVALALSACVLGISAAYLPLHFKRQALAAYQARLEEIRTTVIEADAFKERVASALEHTQFLVDRRLSMPTAAALLNEVTERLPDDTWLIQWRLHGEQLALSGFSPKASSLIAELEDSELLSEVRFASPVTVDPRVERERFNLSAVVTAKPRK